MLSTEHVEYREAYIYCVLTFLMSRVAMSSKLADAMIFNYHNHKYSTIQIYYMFICSYECNHEINI